MRSVNFVSPFVLLVATEPHGFLLLTGCGWCTSTNWCLFEVRVPASGVWSAVSISDVWLGVSVSGIWTDIADSRRTITWRGRLGVSPIFASAPCRQQRVNTKYHCGDCILFWNCTNVSPTVQSLVSLSPNQATNMSLISQLSPQILDFEEASAFRER